jgi:hypothetical protein
VYDNDDRPDRIVLSKERCSQEVDLVDDLKKKVEVDEIGEVNDESEVKRGPK